LLAIAAAAFAFWSDFNHSLATVNLPDQLETLVLGRFFQQDLRYVLLPQSLLHLTLGECFPLERHPLFWPPYLEQLSIKRLFLNVPVDVTFPETLRKLDCDGDILEVQKEARKKSARLCCLRSPRLAAFRWCAQLCCLRVLVRFAFRAAGLKGACGCAAHALLTDGCS